MIAVVYSTETISLCARMSVPQQTRRRSVSMNLAVWLPAMFVLGVVAMGLCYLFLKACEKI
jgi:hypothetical protein